MSIERTAPGDSTAQLSLRDGARLADLPPDRDSAFQRIAVSAGYGSAFGEVFHLTDGDGELFAFQVRETHLNQNGVCHGGAMATFADIAQGRGARRHLAADAPPAVTINLSIDYLAAARPDQWIACRPQILRTARHLIFTQATMLSADRMVARSSAVFAILDR